MNRPRKMWKFVLSATIVAVIIVNSDLVSGHGMLLKPVARGSAWRYYPDAPANYEDSELFCGGFYVRFFSLHSHSDEFRFAELRHNAVGFTCLGDLSFFMLDNDQSRMRSFAGKLRNSLQSNRSFRIR